MVDWWKTTESGARPVRRPRPPGGPCTPPRLTAPPLPAWSSRARADTPRRWAATRRISISGSVNRPMVRSRLTPACSIELVHGAEPVGGLDGHTQVRPGLGSGGGGGDRGGGRCRQRGGDGREGGGVGPRSGATEEPQAARPTTHATSEAMTGVRRVIAEPEPFWRCHERGWEPDTMVHLGVCGCRSPGGARSPGRTISQAPRTAGVDRGRSGHGPWLRHYRRGRGTHRCPPDHR